MSGETGKLFSFHNVGLFSDHFLTKRLPAESPVWASEKASAQAAFDKILAQYKKFKSTYKQPNEAQTEDDFIRPVLAILGYSYIVQTSLKHKGQFNQPDYSLFADEKTKKEAGFFKVKEQEAFYSKALAICDAKYWHRPLDVKLSDKKDTFTNINPSFQIVNYLVGANVDWGILTNGKLWRLYYQKASSRSSNFYETDLEDLLLKGDTEKFLYFYLVFRKEAFLKDSQGKSFLDNVLEGSTHYATELSDRLKEKVFEEIFPHLARGFLHYRKAEQGIKEETEENLKDIYNGTLTLLYRLLFILYAEDRDLLPVKEANYLHYSLANIKQKVAELRDKKATLSELSTDLWNDLDTLFKIIDLGDPKLNVPTYNGGLFSHKNPKNDFLKTNRVPDPWLAEALDRLTREEDKETGKLQSIDYAELEVRHLGSIYEGLLEFHLKIADENKALVKEKGREVYKPVAEVKNSKEIVKKGELYLENDKHERKSTGSYYTPDYIVQYIVQNAVGSVLEEKLKEVERLFSDIEKLRTKARRASTAKRLLAQELNITKQQATDELFSLRVLDPAMGSGHFLVETVDFLSDHIIKFLNDHPENPVLEEIENLRSTILGDLKKKGIQIDEQKLTPTNLVRRMVMKRCIYGVDLNPMAVELAKLSLWLHSFTLGAPLSFLDHHLKCGNSLIGAKVAEVRDKMQSTLFGNQFAGLLSATELMRQVGELTDSTFEEVQESQEKYEKAADALKPFKLILDLWTSEHFGNKGAQDFLTHGGDVEAFLKGNGRLPQRVKELREETEKLSQAKRVLHWELEFPEVFYEKAREKENPGFDAVIGNPPWGGLRSLRELDSFAKATFVTAGKASDWFALFIENSFKQVAQFGHLGMVVPGGWQTAVESKDLRKLIAHNLDLKRFVNLPYDVFPEAYTEAVIITGRIQCLKPNDWKYVSPRILVYGRRESVADVREDDPRWFTAKYESWFKLDPENLPFFTFWTQDDLSLGTKVIAKSVPLGSICDVQRGITPFFPTQDGPQKNFSPALDGELRRYTYDFNGTHYVEYHPEIAEYKSPKYFRDRRGIIRQLISRQFRIQAVITTESFVVNQSHQIILANNKEPDLGYCVALLNSRLLSHYHVKKSALALRDDFPKLVLDDTRSLPIRSINFTTPEKGRCRFLDKAKTLYNRCLAKEDFLCVTGFVDHCLKQKAEQADVVHDLLAFLAERMMEMNKEKQVETRGFLEWLEANIGAKVDNLKNKTKITAYHEGSLEDLLEILKENRKVLKVNPASKDFFDALKSAFEKSLAKLSPLKANLATTDRLIDFIVYQLYGLAEAEIKIVEGG